MKLGFIGTGKITSSVVTGICRSKISFKKILVSSRNRNVARKLKKQFRKVSIAKNNQEIVNSCNWIFLAVTPPVGQKIIKHLKFRSSQTIVSFISTMTLPQLKKVIKVKAKIVRAIPLPPISLRKGPVPVFPPNKKVRNFFNKLGTTVEIKNEKGETVEHTPEFVSTIFDEELEKLLSELPEDASDKTRETFKEARRISEEMITTGQFDPI